MKDQKLSKGNLNTQAIKYHNAVQALMFNDVNRTSWAKSRAWCHNMHSLCDMFRDKIKT